jgi:uncharacterized protein
MIIVDTGAFVALFDKKDSYHASAKKAFDTNQKLITTYPVITETCHMLSRQAGHKAQANFLKSLLQIPFEVFHLQQHHVERMIELIERYADSQMDMADASLVVLAEELGHGRILTVDFKDFYTCRWFDRNTFELLIEPQSRNS